MKVIDQKNGEQIRILMVDDHAVVREGLQRMLAQEEDMVVVGEADGAEGLLTQTELLHPDIVLMDMKMPHINGVQATRQLKERGVTCPVLMLTLYDEYMVEALQAGAKGYLLKDIKREELVSAIRRIHHGEIVVGKSLGVPRINEALAHFKKTMEKEEEAKKAKEAEAKARADIELAARKKAEREAEEAKKAKEAEAKARADIELAARKKAEREAEEAKKAKEAEAKARADIELAARKKAEREAEEARKKAEREAEEAKKAKEAEAKARADIELAAKKKAEREAEEAKKAKEAEAKAKAKIDIDLAARKKAESDELYKGIVKLVITPPVVVSQLTEFEKHLNEVQYLCFVLVNGRMDKGNEIVVSVENPIPLVDILRQMTLVEQVAKNDKNILVTLKPPVVKI